MRSSPLSASSSPFAADRANDEQVSELGSQMGNLSVQNTVEMDPVKALEKRYIKVIQQVEVDRRHKRNLSCHTVMRQARMRDRLQGTSEEPMQTGTQHRQALKKTRVSHVQELLEERKQQTYREDFSNPVMKGIMEDCCNLTLASLLPDHLIEAVSRWLKSASSPLSATGRILVNSLHNPEQCRKLIAHNEDLAKGTLTILDDIHFSIGSRLSPGPGVQNMGDDKLPDFSRLSFQMANMEFMHLHGLFRQCNFTGAHLLGAVFCCGSDFHGARFDFACLDNARFTGVDITGTSWEESSIDDVYFEGNMQGCGSLADHLFLHCGSPSQDDVPSWLTQYTNLQLCAGQVEKTWQQTESLLQRISFHYGEFDDLVDTWFEGTHNTHLPALTRDSIMNHGLTLYQSLLKSGDGLDSSQEKDLLECMTHTSDGYDWQPILEVVLQRSGHNTCVIAGAVSLLISKGHGQQALTFLKQAMEKFEETPSLICGLNGFANLCQNTVHLAVQYPDTAPDCLTTMERAERVCIGHGCDLGYTKAPRNAWMSILEQSWPLREAQDPHPVASVAKHQTFQIEPQQVQDTEMS